MIRPSDDAAPPFVLKRDGSGIGLTWKSLGALITAVAIFVAAWVNLKSDVSNHSEQLTQVKTDLHEVKATVTADHDQLTRINGKLDAILTEQRITNGR